MLRRPDDESLDVEASETYYRTRNTRDGVEREVSHAGLTPTRVVAPADGAGIVTTSWDGTITTVTTLPDPRAELGVAGSYASTTSVLRPGSAVAGDETTTIITRSRSVPVGAELFETLALPPAAAGLDPSTFERTVAPEGSGWVTTMTPPSGRTDLLARVHMDGRGRTTRVDTPGEHPTCIEYPAGSESTRPRLIRQSTLASGTCSPSAPSTERRETRFVYDDDDDEADPHWLREIHAGLTPAEELVIEIEPDARGWTDTVTVPHTSLLAGDTNVIDVTYDQHGNVTGFRPPGRTTHAFSYTARDGLETYEPPATPAHSGEEIESSEYRPSGSLRRRTFRGRAVLETTLNGATGYLEMVSVSDDVSPSGVSMSNDVYISETDAGGRPLAIETTMGDMAIAYDGAVEVREAWTLAGTAGVEGSIAREVGAAMLLDAETAAIGSGTTATSLRIAYGYDIDRLMTSAGATGETGVTLEHDFTLGSTLTTVAGALTTRAHATPLGETASIRTEDAAGDVIFETRICARDEHGRITRRVELWRVGSSVRQRQLAYEYDGRGFLRFAGETLDQTADADPCAFALADARGTTWTYDAAGNRLDLAVNAEDQATVGDREYDELGHLSRRGNTTYSYDVFGHLRSTSTARIPAPPRRPFDRPAVGLPTPGTAATYDFDALGRLVAIHPTGGSALIERPEQRFVYRDGLNPIAWQRSDRACGTGGVTTLVFVYASMPDTPDLAYVDTCSDGDIDATWRYLADERGSVRLVIDLATGNVVEELEYDAWGALTSRAPSAQPFGYIGGIHDAETGFWHLGARDYDPTIGRWTTKDPIGFGGGPAIAALTLPRAAGVDVALIAERDNLYAYCHGDPIGCTDASGLQGGPAETAALTGAAVACGPPCWLTIAIGAAGTAVIGLGIYLIWDSVCTSSGPIFPEGTDVPSPTDIQDACRAACAAVLGTPAYTPCILGCTGNGGPAPASGGPPRPSPEGADA